MPSPEDAEDPLLSKAINAQLSLDVIADTVFASTVRTNEILELEDPLWQTPFNGS